jgi:predicted RNase H-like HicB family nuclease
MTLQRPDAVTAAKKFVKRHFPDCFTALLAGSVIRGREHAGSDLDIVVIADYDEPNWATFEEFGWMIEVFVRTPETCSAFGETPAQALAEVELAKEAWLEAAKSEGKPIPEPKYCPIIYQLAS